MPIKPRRYRFVMRTSFTGLMRQNQRVQMAESAPVAVLPVLDESEHGTDDGYHLVLGEKVDLYAFPKGARAGLCLHEILETQMPQSVADDNGINDILTRYGFDACVWQGVIKAMLLAVRDVRVLPDHRLGAMCEHNALYEWKFLLHSECFPLKDIQAWLGQAHLGLDECIVRAAKGLNVHDVHGFIDGVMDVVCQSQDGDMAIIDYKSNDLGASAEYYDAQHLAMAMAEHHYYVQALIYAVAVARYLNTRGALPERILVRYVFLRGVMSGQGVWAWDINTADLRPWL